MRFYFILFLFILALTVVDAATARIRIVLKNDKSYTLAVNTKESSVSSVIPYGHSVRQVLIKYGSTSNYSDYRYRVYMYWANLFVYLWRLFSSFV